MNSKINLGRMRVVLDDEQKVRFNTGSLLKNPVTVVEIEKAFTYIILTVIFCPTMRTGMH